MESRFDATLDACRFLESQGFVYGGDFFLRDAIRMAGEVILEVEEEPGATAGT